MRLQPIYDIAEICSRHDIKNVVVCPGSRCAPLTLAFSRHSSFSVRTFSDERSAAFIALGIAQQTRQPVVLICTSGSAAYNFAPAIAEAYYSHVPLLILTADRPTEWIGQLDGQTILQKEIYGGHVKKYFELPADYEHNDTIWSIHRIINQAINLCKAEQSGPVHINIPLREPLYPEKGEAIQFGKPIIVKERKNQLSLSSPDYKFIEENWPIHKKILVVAGQNEYDKDLLHILDAASKKNNFAIIGDIISNLHPLAQTIRHTDNFLGQCTDDIKSSLQPDLLITLGRSVISKNLKLFLRKYLPKQHWHIQPAGEVADTFQSLTQIFRCDTSLFFQNLAELPYTSDLENQQRENYKRLWETEEQQIVNVIDDYFSQPAFSEFHFVKSIIDSLPAKINLHLANSMTVRYANFVGLKDNQKGINVFSNRGTSGIDGCTSTTVGNSLVSADINLLITGDLAFFYDRNAFWHNYNLQNLRIIVLNNHGGVIFGIIDGPGDLPEAEEFFITQQKLSAKHLCNEFGIGYAKVEDVMQMQNVLTDFFKASTRPKLLEIETDAKTSKQNFEQFKQLIKKNYES